MEVPASLVNRHVEAANADYQDRVRRAALPPETTEQRTQSQILRDAFADDVAQRFRDLIADRIKVTSDFGLGERAREEYSPIPLSTTLDAPEGVTRVLLAVPFRKLYITDYSEPIEAQIGFDIAVESSDQPASDGHYLGDVYSLRPDDRGSVGRSLEEFAEFLSEVIALNEL